MKLRAAILSAMMLTVLVAFGQKVATDYDRNFNFSQVHTFALKMGTPWGNPLTEGRVKEAVTKELQSKGWTPADESTADAIVVIHGATRQEQSLDTFYSGGGYYGWGYGGGGMATTTVNEIKIGTLVVDIFNAKDKKLLFRGTASDEVSDKPEKNTKKIDKGVEKMFKDFPPKAKSE